MKEYIITQEEIGKILIALRSRDYATARNTLSQLKEENKIGEIDKIFSKFLTDHKTSWKYLERHGLIGAKEYGDCVFLNFNDFNIFDELKKRLYNTLESEPDRTPVKRGEFKD